MKINWIKSRLNGKESTLKKQNWRRIGEEFQKYCIDD
jgi:hypothetical protein